MAHILIVDDEQMIRSLLSDILKTGHHTCALAADASQARKCMRTVSFDLILCDINMPGETGLEFIRYTASKFPDTPAVMVTAIDDPMIAEVALKIGVYDFIVKPFAPNGVLISVANALRRRQLEIDNRVYREGLEKIVEERTAALRDSMQKITKALKGSIQAIARTVETRDPHTAGHQQRVANLASAIAEEMLLSDDRIYGIRMAGLIHDLGKVAIPTGILNKPGRISNIEFELIKTHSRVGYNILKDIDFPWPIAQVVLQHHERMDGSGYPLGLTGEKIILEARILAVADVVEAMASHRPYRPALGIDKALKEITQNRNNLYDAGIVDICLRLFREKGFSFK